jgi:hypothetical protein
LVYFFLMLDLLYRALSFSQANLSGPFLGWYYGLECIGLLHQSRK